MANSAELQQRREAAVPRGVSNATAIYAKRAKNAEIWSEDGKRYIDFGAGIAVVNTGHQHPEDRRRRRRAAEGVQPRLLPGHAVRDLCAAGRAAERAGAGREPGQDHADLDRRRGRRERGQDRARLHRPSGRHRLQRRLPRPHPHGHGADRQGRALQEGLRAVPGRRLQRRLSQRLSRGQRRAEPARR